MQKNSPNNSDSISLNKFISSTGICSRREADRLIEEGRVRINGHVAVKGNRVSAGDDVFLDGKKIRHKVATVYIILHKPPGITCTTDRRDPSNVIDFVGYEERIFPVGRLDKNSSGLLLLTNEGDIVNRILRKENRHEKEYLVSVSKNINDQFIKMMSGSIPMLGQRTIPAKVKKVGTKSFKIILTQGLNRQIRRMCEYCGYKVISLKRIRLMHLNLKDLKQGKWRHLSSRELKTLKAAIGGD